MPRSEIRISSQESLAQYLVSLWAYRELLFFLAWRDVLVRYKQTTIGVAWALFKPIFTVATLTFVFGKISDTPAFGVPYPLLVATGTIPWLYFSTAVTESSASVVGNSSLVSKIYFPRLLIPVTSLLVAAIDFGIGLAFFAFYLLTVGWPVEAPIFYLPLFLILLFSVTFGIGVWVSALSVRYRDVKLLVPFLVQFALYASPVGFASNAVPSGWKPFLAINPMVGVLDGIRWTVCGLSPYWPAVIWSASFSIVTMITGVIYFRHLEKVFADII
jgi:lipopolysaccharide transport system permease protein